MICALGLRTKQIKPTFLEDSTPTLDKFISHLSFLHLFHESLFVTIYSNDHILFGRHVQIIYNIINFYLFQTFGNLFHCQE